MPFTKYSTLTPKTCAILTAFSADGILAAVAKYWSIVLPDYEGIMGVPISFLDKYCPEQFEIVGLAPERSDTMINRVFQYKNALQHNSNGTTQSGNKVNDGPTILSKDPPVKIILVKIEKAFYRFCTLEFLSEKNDFA